jgi:hypothetical protein
MFAVIVLGVAGIMRIFDTVDLPLSRILPEKLKGAIFGPSLKIFD